MWILYIDVYCYLRTLIYILLIRAYKEKRACNSDSADFQLLSIIIIMCLFIVRMWLSVSNHNVIARALFVVALRMYQLSASISTYSRYDVGQVHGFNHHPHVDSIILDKSTIEEMINPDKHRTP